RKQCLAQELCLRFQRIDPIVAQDLKLFLDRAVQRCKSNDVLCAVFYARDLYQTHQGAGLEHQLSTQVLSTFLVVQRSSSAASSREEISDKRAIDLLLIEVHVDENLRLPTRRVRWQIEITKDLGRNVPGLAGMLFVPK